MVGKYRLLTIAVIFTLVVMRLASGGTANFAYLLLSAYAFLGRAQAVQALAMSWLFTMLSSGIAPEASLGSIGRYIVFFSAGASVFIRSGFLSGKMVARKPVVATACLGGLFVVHAMLFSPLPDVSILKAFSWTLVTATLFSAWAGLGAADRDKLFRVLYMGLVVVMIVSLPLVFLPLGYLRNGTGLQGILNHPQAFGAAMAILAVLAGSKLCAELKPSWNYLLVFGLCLMLILASEARTAGLSLFAGLFIAIALIPWLSGKSIRSVLPGLRSRRVWGVVGIALSLGLVFSPWVSEKFSHYISKSGRAGSVETLAEAYDRSRGGLISGMLDNINERPLTGLGFGIASVPAEMDIRRDPIFGLPVSASIEKGVLPLAIVEELGILGGSIVGAWFLMLLGRSSRAGVTALSVTTTALVLNMGENTFFSPGGLGLLLLIFATWASSGLMHPSSMNNGKGPK